MQSVKKNCNLLWGICNLVRRFANSFKIEPSILKIFYLLRGFIICKADVQSVQESFNLLSGCSISQGISEFLKRIFKTQFIDLDYVEVDFFFAFWVQVANVLQTKCIKVAYLPSKILSIFSFVGFSRPFVGGFFPQKPQGNELCSQKSN